MDRPVAKVAAVASVIAIGAMVYRRVFCDGRRAEHDSNDIDNSPELSPVRKTVLAAEPEGLPARVLYFATDFVQWILEGKKRATTRVDGFVLEDGDIEVVGDLAPGDRVRALDDDERAFAVLEITQVIDPFPNPDSARRGPHHADTLQGRDPVF